MIKRTILSIFAVLFVFSGSFAQDDGKFRRGGGMMVFTGYGPMKEHPVNLYYYIPTQGNIKKMRVLVSMHGAERSGRIQRGVWRNLAEEYGFIVLAPEFKHDNGYLENGYQFGWVSEDPKIFRLRPREVWTYRLIEAIFDYFKEKTGNVSETYDMFGHSAGGQFVHRYLLAMPEARVGRAVAANPGNYTYPDERGLFTPSGEPADPPAGPIREGHPLCFGRLSRALLQARPDHPDRHRGHRARQPRHGRETIPTAFRAVTATSGHGSSSTPRATSLSKRGWSSTGPFRRCPAPGTTAARWSTDREACATGASRTTSGSTTSRM